MDTLQHSEGERHVLRRGRRSWCWRNRPVRRPSGDSLGSDDTTERYMALETGSASLLSTTDGGEWDPRPFGGRGWLAVDFQRRQSQSADRWPGGDEVSVTAVDNATCPPPRS